MSTDYKNFVERMGSFEDNMDLNDNVSKDNKTVTRNQSMLVHHGILGMRWGSHRAINSNTVGATARTGQSVASLGQTVSKHKANKNVLKDAKHLNDDDLKKITSRLELENRYMNAKTQQSGRSRVEGILATTGSALAVVSSAAVMYDAIKKAGA